MPKLLFILGALIVIGADAFPRVLAHDAVLERPSWTFKRSRAATPLADAAGAETGTEAVSRPSSPFDIDLGDFDKRCRQYLPLLWDAWMHHNPQWEEFFAAFVFQIALESACRPDVVNAIDAAGFGQIMPPAEADCHNAGLRGNRREAVFNAECTAWLQARTGRTFRSERTEECRIVIVWVAHLTGGGWLIRSQKVAQKDGKLAVCWNDGIGEYLDRVITPANANHAHWYARWIAEHSGVAVAMTHYSDRGTHP